MRQFSLDDVQACVASAVKGDAQSHKLLWRWEHVIAVQEFAKAILGEVSLLVGGRSCRGDVGAYVLGTIFGTAFCWWSLLGETRQFHREEREHNRDFWFRNLLKVSSGLGNAHSVLVHEMPKMEGYPGIIMPYTPDAEKYHAEYLQKYLAMLKGKVENLVDIKDSLAVLDEIENLVQRNLRIFEDLMQIDRVVYEYKKSHPEMEPLDEIPISDSQLLNWARGVVKEQNLLDSETPPIERFMAGEKILWPLETHEEEVAKYYLTRYAVSIIRDHLTEGIRNWYPILRDVFRAENENFKAHEALAVAVDERSTPKKCYRFDFDNSDFLIPIASAEVDWTFGISRESACNIVEKIEGISGWKENDEVYFITRQLVENMPVSALDNIVRMIKRGELDQAVDMLAQRIPEKKQEWMIKELAFVVMTPYLTEFESTFYQWDVEKAGFTRGCRFIDCVDEMWYGGRVEEGARGPYSIPRAVAIAIMRNVSKRVYGKGGEA